MHNEALDHIIRQKFASLEVPFRASDWALLRLKLDEAFDQRIREEIGRLILPDTENDWQVFSAKLDALFDGQVRERLSGLQLPAEADFWPMMQALLEGQTADALLLRRLLTLHIAMDPADWADMEQRLDSDSFITQLRDKLNQASLTPERVDWPIMVAHLNADFDLQVRGKLEDVPEEAAADWETFEQQLPFGGVDQQIRNKLESLALEPALGDWYDMASALDEPFDRQVRTRLNALEASAQHMQSDWKRMAAQLGPHATPWWVEWRRYGLAAAIVLLLLIGGGWLSQGTNRGVAKRWITRITSPRLTPAPVLPDASRESAPSFVAETSTDPTNAVGDMPPSDTVARALALLPTTTHSPVNWETSVQDQLARERIKPQAQVAPPSLPAPPEETSSKKWLFVRPLGKNNRSAFALGAPYLQDRLSIEALLPPDRKPAEIRLGLSGAISATKAELSGPNAGPGFLTGLRAEMKINDRWHLVSGLVYGQQRFSHTSYETVDQRTFATALDGYMEVVELPLMMRYHFPSEEKLSLYVQAGMVARLSIRESYEHFTPTSSSNGFNFRATPYQLAPTKRAWSLNTYPGNIQVALGLEYTFSDRLALQFEPFFNQSLQRTKGSGSFGLEKKLYTMGLTVNTVFNLQPKD